VDIISAWASTDRSVQVKTVGKRRSIKAELSTINIDITAAIEIDSGMSIARRCPTLEIWTFPTAEPVAGVELIWVGAIRVRS
jgi:hypothetical protein